MYIIMYMQVVMYVCIFNFNMCDFVYMELLLDNGVVF